MKHYLKYLFIILFLPLVLISTAQDLIPVDTSKGGILFMVDFESGAPGWTTINYNINDLWHVTTLSSSSPSHSMWCGIDAQGNYSTGNTINNAVVSPVINLPATAASFLNLEFNESYNTEGGYDQCMVQITTDGGTSWIDLRGAPTGSSGGWQHRIYNLLPYLGEIIQIRFYFYTIDGIANNYSGWFVDDVTVVTDEKGNGPRDVPTLFLLIDNELVYRDTVITNNWSTLEPMTGEMLLANFGVDTNLIIDTIYSSSAQLQVSQAAEDTIPTAFGTPFNFSYQPLTAGPVSDTIFIISNDTASPFMIILTGKAIDALYAPSPEISFEGDIIGPDNFFNPMVIIDSLLDPETSAAIYVDLQITNKGLSILNINNYFNKYAGNDAFWIDNWSDLSLEFEDTVDITIGFNANRSRRQVFSISYEFYNRNGNLASNDHWVTAQNSYRGTYLEADGPWVSAGPDSLVIDFGIVLVGSSEFENEIWLKNLGSIPLNIDISIVGNDFKYQGEDPLHLEPGQGNGENYEGILFTPSDSVGFKEGMLIFSHNDTTDGAIDTVYLRGKGIKLPAPPDPAELTLYYQGNAVDRDSTIELDMGPVMINNDFEKVDFTVVNTGGTDGYIDLQYISNYFYWIDENGAWWNSLDNVLIPTDDSVKISAAFDPNYGSIFNEWGEIFLEDEYNSIYLDLTGYGIERHAFLVQYMGNDVDEYEAAELYNYNGWKKQVDFTYTNLHESPITIDSISAANFDETTVYDFSGLPVELLPGEQYTFNVSFDPSIPDGLHESMVKIYSTNLTEPVYVFYVDNIANGTGTFEVQCVSKNVTNYGSTVSFGEVSSLDGSRTAKMRIYSTNGYDAIIITADLDENPSYFSFANLPDSTLVPSEDSADFSITFTPRGFSGSTSDEMYLFYNETDYPDYDMFNRVIYLNGYGNENLHHAAKLTANINGIIIPNSGEINFGNALINYGIENILVALQNSGVQYVTVQNISFSNPAFSLLEWENMSEGFEVWYYGPEVLSVYFNPDEVGSEEGTMTISSDDPTNPEYVINLKGTGTSGVGEVILEGLSLYPNPASGSVQINTGTNGISMVEFYNSSGKLVYSNNISDGNSVDISEYESGIYIIKISTENNTEFLKLVVE